MALIQNLFDNISRIGYDNCDLTNKTVGNTNASNYMLENYNVYAPMSCRTALGVRMIQAQLPMCASLH